MPDAAPAAPHPTDPDERYRLYIDESGDHTWRQLDDPARRYLCLLGCFFRGAGSGAFGTRGSGVSLTTASSGPARPLGTL